MLFFDGAFFCRRCEAMATSKSCPHGDCESAVFSGTKVGDMLRAGREPPPEFIRPEAARVLMEAVASEIPSI